MAPNKHQQKTEATRLRLTAAALRIFTRDGFFAARIEEIASVAGYTRGAFYANFESKEDLFLAVLEAESAKHLQKLSAALEKTPESERLGILREYYADRARDAQWSILTLEFKLYALRHGKAGARWARAHREIRDRLRLQFIENVLPRNIGRQYSSKLQPIVLEVVLNGLVLERAYNPKGISERELRNVLGDAFDMFVGAEVAPVA